MPKADSRPPKVIVFDADGTLFDSFELIYAAHVHTATVHGQTPPSRDVFRSHLGKSLLQLIGDLYPGANHEHMIETNGEYVAAHLIDSLPFDGLHDLLQQLHGDGYKLALLTGGNRRIHDVLRHHKIAHYFSSVVHFERTVRPKPDAEGFLLAVAECGVTPSEAVMVGDTTIDMQTGVNAGAQAVIGITHGMHSREQLLSAGADYIIDSLPALPAVLLGLEWT